MNRVLSVLSGPASRVRGVADWVRMFRLDSRSLIESVRGVQNAEATFTDEKWCIEKRYMEVATALESIVVMGCDLVGQCTHLTELDSGDKGVDQTILDTQELVNPGLEKVEEGTRGMEELASDLVRHDANLEEMLRIDDRLKSTLQPLKFIQTLFRVECSHHPHDVQEKFIALVMEIAQVNKVFSELFPKLTAIRERIGELSSRISAQVKEQRETVSERRKKIEQTIETVQRDLERNQTRHQHMADYSEVLRGKTNEVVVAIQCQDAFSQKYGHAKSAMDEINDRTDRIRTARNRKERSDSLIYIDQASSVLVAQMDAMEEDLKNAENQIGLNLKSILSGAEDFQGEMQQLGGGSGSCELDCERARDACVLTCDEGDDSCVLTCDDSYEACILDCENYAESLTVAIEEVGGLLGDMDRDSGESQSELESILEMTEGVSESMRELSIEIHLIGLNSQVKAAHLGGGTGLETLSARTSVISREISVLSNEVACKVEHFDKGLRESIERFSPIQEASRLALKTLSRSKPKVLSRLDRNSAESNQAIARIEETTQTLREQAILSLEVSQLRPQSLKKLSGLRSRLRLLSDNTKMIIRKTGASSDSTEFSDAFAQSYTMESERATHQLVIGASDVSSEIADDASSGDDILFFDDLPAEPSEVADNASSEDDILFFDDLPAEPGEEEPKKDDGNRVDELDGIELWS